MAFDTTNEENSSSKFEELLKEAAPLGNAQQDRDAERSDGSSILSTKKKLDRYEIEAELGRGGMGIVYRAADPFLKETVALKVLVSTQFNEAHFVRFQKEAKAISALSHPGFVKVFNFGIESGNPFMVLEFINGVSLSSHIKEHGALEPLKALQIASQIATAMAHAHNHNVLHRDLKPSNIMLVNKDNQQSVKIIDFGIAVLMNQEITGRYVTPSDALIGTPAYMSPEQIGNRGFDKRSDLYSLGCILFEMLKGAPPFVGDSALEVMHMHCANAIPRLSLGVSHVDELLNRLIEAALQKEPEQRAQSMEEFSESIALTIESTEILREPFIPPEAIDPPPDQSLSKEVKTSVSAIAGIICLCATLACAAIVYYWPKQEHFRLKNELKEAQPFLLGLESKMEKHSDERILELLRTSHPYSIKISKGTVTDKGISYLKGLPIRHVLASDLENVTEKGIAEICSLKHLRTLDLSANKKVTVDALKKIKNIKPLHILLLDKCDLTPDGLREISGCKRLTRLSLAANSAVGADHLNVIADMPYLQVLNIANTNLDGKDLKKLTKLPHLHHLNLASNQGVTEADLIDLIKHCPVLETLNIDGTGGATDKVVQIAASSISIKYLIGFDCPNISEAARKDFSKLPNRRFIDAISADNSEEDLDAIVNKPKLVEDLMPWRGASAEKRKQDSINRKLKRKRKQTRTNKFDFSEP